MHLHVMDSRWNVPERVNNEAAISNFNELLTAHPDDVTGYFQLGQLLARLGQNQEARNTSNLVRSLLTGRIGDSHAASEISTALADLPH